MLVKTRGIVLHAFKYGESSLITEVYTEELGLRRYIVSGVRSRKPRFPAMLFQVLSPLELVVYHREDRDLNRIREARLERMLQQIPFDHRRGAIALFLAELIRKTVREAATNPELFAFLCRAIDVLDQSTEALGDYPVYVLVQLSVMLGFQPSGRHSPDTPVFQLQEGVFSSRPTGDKHVLNPDLSMFLSRFLEAGWEEFAKIDCPLQYRRALLDQMLLYYRLHLDHFQGLNSPDILRKVLS